MIRAKLLLLLHVTSLIYQLVSAEQAAAVPPSNFLLIMADDMGWGDPQYNGGNALTPHLNEIAASKHTIVFNRFCESRSTRHFALKSEC